MTDADYLDLLQLIDVDPARGIVEHDILAVVLRTATPETLEWLTPDLVGEIEANAIARYQREQQEAIAIREWKQRELHREQLAATRREEQIISAAAMAEFTTPRDNLLSWLNSSRRRKP